MGGIGDALRRHRLVGIDTSIFIYQVEAVPRFVEAATTALVELERGGFAGVTSMITLMELAVQPLRMGRPDIADEYQSLLENFPNLTLAELDRDTMRAAAQLRAIHRLRPADALQAAACIHHGTTAFLTNDRGLRRVTDFEVLTLEDFIGN